jgi:hypothetical protein
LRLRLLIPIALFALTGCSPPQDTSGQPAGTSPNEHPEKASTGGSAGGRSTPQDDAAAVLVGAGDIAGCDTLASAEATAKLLDAIPGTVFGAGDFAYPDGAPESFANCYDPTWGRHKARTRPATGNHDYYTKGASGYFNYFGGAAGDPAKGYYSYGSGPGTSSPLTATARRSVVVTRVRPRNGGFEPTWLHTLRPARWLTGITRCSPRADMAMTTK